jgi:cyclase
MEQVTDRVYAATDLRGCNHGYVVTSDGIVVIDTPQLPSKAVEMREQVLEKGPIRFLINTEHHIDHIFGNHFFAGLCPVVANEFVSKDFWVDIRGTSPYRFMIDVIKESDPEGMGLMPLEKDFVVNAPGITFREHMTLRLGEHTFELIHTPGHTPGQIAVYIPQEKVLFTGDTLFHQCQTWFHASDPESWLRSLGLIKGLDVDFIIPGHGPVCTKDYIPKQGAFIREWVTAVAVGIANGWTREQCAERISFLDRFPMDIGQQSVGPLIQRLNVERLFDLLQGNIEGF